MCSVCAVTGRSCFQSILFNISDIPSIPVSASLLHLNPFLITPPSVAAYLPEASSAEGSTST